MSNEYPRMLYRVSFDESKIIWNAFVDTKIVQNKSEHRKSNFYFWLSSPSFVCIVSIAIHSIINFSRKFSREIVAAILALSVGVILFHYQESAKQPEKKSSPQVSTHASHS